MSDFQSLLASQTKPHKETFDFLTLFVKDAFSLPTLLVLGGLIQAALFAVLPYRVALAPTALLALYALLTTLGHIRPPQSLPAAPNDPYLADVVPGYSTAQLPDPSTGLFGREPAAQPVLVFHFGVRFNHPLGLLAPGAKETGDHFIKCNNEVHARRTEFGLLGMTQWRGAERASNNTLLNIFYFRDVEGLNRFAHDRVHRDAWKFLANAGLKHIGFFHEAFAVPRHAYETIYANLQPTLLGATSVRLEGEKEGEERWIQPLVSLDHPRLRGQMARMGRAVAEKV